MRLLLCVLALAMTVVSGQALAGTRTFNGTANVGPNTTVPSIPTPGTEATTFTAYNGGSYRYALHVFTVDQSGIYTASSVTTGVTNTTWFLNGLFSPGLPPSTPLSAYIVSVFAGGGVSPYTSNFTGFNLTAGNTYTVLVAFNSNGGANVYNDTVTITGPGNIIDCGGTTCALPAPVPTTSEWTLILIGLLLAAGAAVMIARRRSIA